MESLTLLTLVLFLVEGPLFVCGKSCTLKTYYYDPLTGTTRVQEVQTCDYGCCGMNMRYCCTKPTEADPMPLGTKVGIALGCVAAVVIVAVIAIIMCRRKMQRSKQAENPVPPYSPRHNKDARVTDGTIQTSTAVSNHAYENQQFTSEEYTQQNISEATCRVTDGTIQTSTAVSNHAYDNHQFTSDEYTQQNRPQTHIEDRNAISSHVEQDMKPQKAGTMHVSPVNQEMPRHDDRPYDTSSTKAIIQNLSVQPQKPKHDQHEQHNTPDRRKINENGDKPNHPQSVYVNKGYAHERKDPSHRKKLFGSQQHLPTEPGKRQVGLASQKYKSEMYLAGDDYGSSLRQAAAKTFTSSSHQLHSTQHHYKSTPNLYLEGPKLSLHSEIDFSEKNEKRKNSGRNTMYTSNERLRGSTPRLYPVQSTMENSVRTDIVTNERKYDIQRGLVTKNRPVSTNEKKPESAYMKPQTAAKERTKESPYNKTPTSANEKGPASADRKLPSSEKRKAPAPVITSYMAAPPTATVTLPPSSKSMTDSSI